MTNIVIKGQSLEWPFINYEDFPHVDYSNVHDAFVDRLLRMVFQNFREQFGGDVLFSPSSQSSWWSITLPTYFTNFYGFLLSCDRYRRSGSPLRSL